MKEFTLPFQAVVFLNYFGSVPNKRDFFRPYLVGICFLLNYPSQLKLLYSDSEGKFCQYLSQRSLCPEAKKQGLDVSLHPSLVSMPCCSGSQKYWMYDFASKFD